MEKTNVFNIKKEEELHELDDATLDEMIANIGHSRKETKQRV